LNKAIIAVIAITILESIALIKDIDGALFGIAIAAISGLGGFAIGKAPSKKK